MQENCHCFWPLEEGGSVVHGKLSITLISVETNSDIVIRKMQILEGSAQLYKPNIVTLLQLTSWPMKGLPLTATILTLINELTVAQMRASKKQTVIMCRSEPYNYITTVFKLYCSVFDMTCAIIMILYV